MSKNTLVVRPAWRREWGGFLLLAIFIFCIMNMEILLFYVSSPLNQLQVHLQRRIDFAFYAKAILVFLSVLVAVQILFRHYRHRYQFTADGVAHIIGILGREERPLRYGAITLATKKQSVVEFMLGIGTLSLFSSGTDTADVVIVDVPAPKRLLTRIQAGMSQSASSRLNDDMTSAKV